MVEGIAIHPYAGYNEQGKRPNVTLLACMAHAGRYFEKALNNDRELSQWQ